MLIPTEFSRTLHLAHTATVENGSFRAYLLYSPQGQASRFLQLTTTQRTESIAHEMQLRLTI